MLKVLGKYAELEWASFHTSQDNFKLNLGRDLQESGQASQKVV